MGYLHNVTMIPQRLKTARVLRGLSQRALGTLAGRSASGISAIERGHQLPSLELLCRLCVALELSADWLLGAMPGLDPPKPGAAS